MSDQNCSSTAQVELATSLGTWFGPLIAAIAGILVDRALDAYSKKSPTPTAADTERSLSDEVFPTLRGLEADINSMRSEARVTQESMDALRDNLQRQIDAISSTGGKVPDIACQASYPARQDPET
ncbi:hypothetical protein EN45_103330 [Penicillium chrysogenum]|jgi:hypothetical protein|nr:uncharacterized protein N7525_006046 [Penicillium rubens]KAJ5840858.1 hypothetical protein N7525_006046 [Penicillium rubens]KZN86136.1 hypothetical protein EN45_103330 [Penicillium chrysogenum]